MGHDALSRMAIKRHVGVCIGPDGAIHMCVYILVTDIGSKGRISNYTSMCIGLDMMGFDVGMRRGLNEI